jgi:probable sugar efflux transporter
MTPLAARVAPHGKRAVGLAAVMGGTIVATVLGVPIGTNLGHYFGWHMSFFIIGIGSALVFVVIYFVLPLCESTQAGSLKSLPVILKRPGLQQLYFLTVITVLGQFTAYSYLNPILATAGGLDEGMIVTMLFVFGIAGIIGTVIGSKTVDRHCAATLLISMAVVCVSLALLTVSAQATASLTFVVICWGAAMTAVCLAFQTVLLNVAPDAADVATSLYSGIFNVGIGGGAFIGSRVSQAAGFMPVAYVGAALVAVSLLSLVIVRAKSGRWLLGGTPTVREKGEPVHETP